MDMKPQTYPQIWRTLTAEQKQQLAEEVETTYDYLKLIACRDGRCGLHLANAIASVFIKMGYHEGSKTEAREVFFPHLNLRNGRQQTQMRPTA